MGKGVKNKCKQQMVEETTCAILQQLTQFN